MEFKKSIALMILVLFSNSCSNITENIPRSITSTWDTLEPNYIWDWGNYEHLPLRSKWICLPKCIDINSLTEDEVNKMVDILEKQLEWLEKREKEEAEKKLRLHQA